METKTVRIMIRGIVQGVGFRYHTKKTALALGIRGTVRNLPSGEVEIFAEGSRAAVEELMTWLKRGPALSRVSRVDTEDLANSLNANDFSIIG